MTLAKFLREEIGIRSRDVDALEKLAGKRVGGSIGFLPDLEAARGAIEPWMCVHFLPIGDYSGSVLGTWLRPKDVAAGRLVTAQAGAGEMLGHGTLEHLVYAELLSLESSYPDPASKYFKGPFDLARAAFGEELYRPGSHGELDDGIVEKLAATEKGGSAAAWSALVLPRVDPSRESLRKAIATDPDCLYFHAMAAREAAAAKRQAEAAKSAAQALECHFESAYTEELDDFLDFARGLAKVEPVAFESDACQLALAMGDAKKHAAVSAEIGDRGNLAAVEKTVCDTLWLAGDFDGSLDVLQELYRRLGWRWALALCGLRSP